MIIDDINHLSRYPLEGNMGKAFAFMKSTDWSCIPLGKTEICGDDVYVNVMEPDVSKPCEVWESHKHYADIHLTIAGSELFRCLSPQNARVKKEYCEEGDYSFFEQVSGIAAEAVLVPGAFAVQFPGEIHQPNNIPDGEARYLKKAVLKIRLD